MRHKHGGIGKGGKLPPMPVGATATNGSQVMAPNEAQSMPAPMPSALSAPPPSTPVSPMPGVTGGSPGQGYKRGGMVK